MNTPDFVPENEVHNVLWDFDRETDPLFSARRPDLVIVNIKKEELPNNGLFNNRRKFKENEKRDK